MIGKSSNTFTPNSKTVATARSSASPDIITLTDCIATLFRAGRYDNMDQVFAEAVERGIILRSNRLDSQWETDLSGMSIPVASAASRYILNNVKRNSLDSPSDEQDLRDMTFITGVGKSYRKDRRSTKEGNSSLRDFLQSMLQKDFDPPLESHIPAFAQGTVVVKKESLARWIQQ